MAGLSFSDSCPLEYIGLPVRRITISGEPLSIYMLDINGNTTSVLVGGNFLNFSKTHEILSINVLEDLLFWTDDRNQPRKININRAYNQPFSSGDPYYYTEDHISVAKFAPVLPISFVVR